MRYFGIILSVSNEYLQHNMFFYGKILNYSTGHLILTIIFSFCFYFQCREIGSESHEDILKTLYELQKVCTTNSYWSHMLNSAWPEEEIRCVFDDNSGINLLISS